MKTENIVFEQGNSQIIKEGNRFFTRTTENEECLESGDFNTLERAKESLGILPTTTENNKIIAEFMELFESSINGIYWTDYVIEENHKIGIGSMTELHYHSDWNWLMKVVEKCEKIRLNSSISAVKYDKIMDLIVNGLQQTNIDLVYKSCIEFIKWYNQQNQK